MPSSTPTAPAARSETSVTNAEGAQSVLIIDDSQICRDMVCKVLADNGFLVVTACDGESGLQKLASNRCAMILLDNDMPKMTGLGFLKALRSEPRWATLPVVMLTTSNSKAVIVEAIKYRIAGYVLKERLAMPELLQRVRNVINQKPAASLRKPVPAPINVPNLVPRDATLSGIAGCEAVRTLAGVAKQITAIAEAPRASCAEVSAIVRQDPMLAGRVIQLACCGAYNGTRLRMASIDDAVRIVGIGGVRDAAAAMGVFSGFPEHSADGINLLRCWQHAFAVAQIMGRLVPKTDAVAPGVPYVVGLCHDLAEMLLRQKFPREYAAAEDYAVQSGVHALEMLPAVFGIGYAELTQSLLERMQFPESLAQPINELHKTRAIGGTESCKSLLGRTLAIANLMAHGMLLCSSTDNLVSPVAFADCRSWMIPSAAMNVAELRSEAMTAVHMLADLPMEMERALSVPLIDRRETAVLYLRHPALAHLDPLEVALKSLSNAEVRERVPDHDELANFEGIVAAAPSAQDPIFSSLARQRSQLSKPVPLLKLSLATDAQIAAGSPLPEGSLHYPLPLRSLVQFVEGLALHS